MNSKGIEPKVGMVYAMVEKGATVISDIRVITGFSHPYDEMVIDTDVGDRMSSVANFREGGLQSGRYRYEIIWSKETRDEWLRAAKGFRDRINGKYNFDLTELAKFVWCVPSLHDDMEFELGESGIPSLEIAAQICESLAYDGSVSE